MTGRYRVTLVGAPDLDTPTTGTLVLTKDLDNGLVARTYTATEVRDFAWAAGRLEQVTGNAGATKVVVSYRAGAVTKVQAQRMLAAAQKSVSTFAASFGPYPYPELDVVLGAFPDFGGMEYPTIVFSEVDKWTVAHEVAHQWWYGLVGNDQYAEPWLDESLATWSEELAMPAWVQCSGYTFPGVARLTNDMGYWGSHPAQYDVVYEGGACMLQGPGESLRQGTLHRDPPGLRRRPPARRGPHGGLHRGRRGGGRATACLQPADFWATWRVDTP